MPQAWARQISNAADKRCSGESVQKCKQPRNCLAGWLSRLAGLLERGKKEREGEGPEGNNDLLGGTLSAGTITAPVKERMKARSKNHNKGVEARAVI